MTDTDSSAPLARPAGACRLSVILIARNESANLRDCLASVAFADQIVVVEHGSSDDTAALALSLGAEVHSSDDWPGFGPQKNRALDRARGDWVLSLDADERLSDALAAEIRAITMRPAPATPAAYELSRLTQFCGRWIRHCGWTPDRVLRLFPRGAARFSDDRVHERVVLRDGIAQGRLRAPLLHYSYPTPAHYWRKLEQYSREWAEQQHARGRRTTMLRAALSGVVAFTRSYVLRLGFLDGAMGFAVCAMQAQAAFGKYFALYCLHARHDEPPPR